MYLLAEFKYFEKLSAWAPWIIITLKWHGLFKKINTFYNKISETDTPPCASCDRIRVNVIK